MSRRPSTPVSECDASSRFLWVAIYVGIAVIGVSLYCLAKNMSETPMRSSYLVIILVVLLSACASQQFEISSTNVTRWENRDVSELIAAIGPYDTTSIQGDSRQYFWSRFAVCKVTARTTREEKIVKIDVQGTPQICKTYLEKLGEGDASAPKP